jgi:hypothetical protein
MFVLQKRLLPVLYHMHGSQGRRGPFTLSQSLSLAHGSWWGCWLIMCPPWTWCGHCWSAGTMEVGGGPCLPWCPPLMEAIHGCESYMSSTQKGNNLGMDIWKSIQHPIMPDQLTVKRAYM